MINIPPDPSDWWIEAGITLGFFLTPFILGLGLKIYELCKEDTGSLTQQK